jgi:3-hydroxyisobutyrate dehydrogenase-like beta-hydroxyacid dehydrogenase
MDRAQPRSDRRVGIVGSGSGAESLAWRLAVPSRPVAWFDPASKQRSEVPVDGVLRCHALGELRSRVDVIVTWFEDEEALRTILLGDGGLARVPGDALSVLDVSSVSPWILQDLATDCREAAVALFGGILIAAVAETGQRLKLYVDRGALEADGLRDVLVRLADDVVPTGAPGTAKAVGIINDLLVGVNTAVVREALALGGLAGIDPRTLTRLVLTGSGANEVMARHLAADDPSDPVTLVAGDCGRIRRGIEGAMAAAHRVDHSLFFGSFAIASLLTHAQAAPGACARDGRVTGRESRTL